MIKAFGMDPGWEPVPRGPQLRKKTPRGPQLRKKTPPSVRVAPRASRPRRT